MASIAAIVNPIKVTAIEILVPLEVSSKLSSLCSQISRESAGKTTKHVPLPRAKQMKTQIDQIVTAVLGGFQKLN